jgi:hypothetical protein
MQALYHRQQRCTTTLALMIWTPWCKNRCTGQGTRPRGHEGHPQQCGALGLQLGTTVAKLAKCGSGAAAHAAHVSLGQGPLATLSALQ